MKYTKRNAYFGSARVNNIQSLPFTWYFERITGGGNLYVYFSPDQNFPMEIHGIFELTPASLGQDLTSKVTTANLGIPIQLGAPAFATNAALAPGQLVVNQVDLAGSYETPGSLQNYINSGIIRGVHADFVIDNFVLSSTTEPPIPIYVQTTGLGFVNGVQFVGEVFVATTGDLGNVTYAGGVLPDYGVNATITNNVPGALVIDGGSPAVGNRVLIKDQILSYQNGIYVVTNKGSIGAPWILTRAPNYNEAFEITEGSYVQVSPVGVNADKAFIQTAIVTSMQPFVGIGSPIIFTQFNSLSFSNFSTIDNPAYDVFNAIGYDTFYLTYLRYALAERICTEYNYEVPIGVAKQLMEYEAWIKKKSRVLDLRLEKTSSLQRRGDYSWAWINLGQGFVSPS